VAADAPAHEAEPFLGHGPLSCRIELGTLVGQAAMFKPSATDVTEFAGRFYTPPCNVSV
jgi:hypothetical protein